MDFKLARSLSLMNVLKAFLGEELMIDEICDNHIKLH